MLVPERKAVFDAVAEHLETVRPTLRPKVQVHYGMQCYVIEIVVSDQFWFHLELRGEEYRPYVYGLYSLGVSDPDYLDVLVGYLDEFQTFYDAGTRMSNRLKKHGVSAVTQLRYDPHEYSMDVKLLNYDLVMLMQSGRRGIRYQINKILAYDHEDGAIEAILKLVLPPRKASNLT